MLVNSGSVCGLHPLSTNIGLSNCFAIWSLTCMPLSSMSGCRAIGECAASFRKRLPRKRIRFVRFTTALSSVGLDANTACERSDFIASS